MLAISGVGSSFGAGDHLHRIDRLAVLIEGQHRRAGIDQQEPAGRGQRAHPIEVGEQARIGRQIAGRLGLGPRRVAQLRVDRIHVGCRATDRLPATAPRRRSAGSGRRASLAAEHRIGVDHAGRRPLDRLDILDPGGGEHLFGGGDIGRACRSRLAAAAWTCAASCGPRRSRRTARAEGSRSVGRSRACRRRRGTRSACDMHGVVERTRPSSRLDVRDACAGLGRNRRRRQQCRRTRSRKQYPELAPSPHFPHFRYSTNASRGLCTIQAAFAMNRCCRTGRDGIATTRCDRPVGLVLADVRRIGGAQRRGIGIEHGRQWSGRGRDRRGVGPRRGDGARACAARRQGRGVRPRRRARREGRGRDRRRLLRGRRDLATRRSPRPSPRRARRTGRSASWSIARASPTPPRRSAATRKPRRRSSIRCSSSSWRSRST